MTSDTNTLTTFFQNIATGDINRISPFLNSNIINSNCTDETNQNAIFYAAMTIKDDLQCLTIIKFLIENGVDPEIFDSNYQTVVYYTCAAGLLECTKYLYENYNFDKYGVDIKKQTPVFYAVAMNRLDIVQFLHSKGFDLNHLDINGENCLFCIKVEKQFDVAKFLIDSGVDYTVKNKWGVSYESYCRMKGLFEVWEYVEEVKGKVMNEERNEIMENGYVEDKIEIMQLSFRETQQPLNNEEMEEFIKKYPDIARIIMNNNLNASNNINIINHVQNDNLEESENENDANGDDDDNNNNNVINSSRKNLIIDDEAENNNDNNNKNNNNENNNNDTNNNNTNNDNNNNSNNNNDNNSVNNNGNSVKNENEEDEIIDINL